MMRPRWNKVFSDLVGNRVRSLLVIASIMNLSTIPHPAWFWVANLAVVAVTPFLGARFGAEA